MRSNARFRLLTALPCALAGPGRAPHFAHASKRRLYARVGWLLCIVLSKVHHRFKQRAHLSEFVETAMRILRQIDHLFSAEEPLDEASKFPCYKA